MSAKVKLETKFAPPERIEGDELKKQIELIESKTLTKQFLDALPLFVTVLNKYRQFVYVNKAFIEFLGVKDKWKVLGLRPGEAVHCIHAYENEAGCGTTEFCRYCGAVNSILEAQKGISNEKECLITQENHNVLDLLVWSYPIQINGEQFIIFTIKDIQHFKRRRALEKIFFHDVLNTAGNLRGFSTLLLEAQDPQEIKEYTTYISEMTERLIEEIQSQKDLLAAENDELVVEKQIFSTMPTLERLKKFFEKQRIAKGKNILIDPQSEQITFQTDGTLVRRVITNMLKNALEASKEGETVTIGVKQTEEGVDFYVHNPAYIPFKIQSQIFNRNFSTKGANRGLGTYSMRLLTEKYLKGKVYFETDKEKGTTFHAVLPKE